MGELKAPGSQFRSRSENLRGEAERVPDLDVCRGVVIIVAVMAQRERD